MVVEIPDRIIATSTYTVEEFKLDIAVMLYQKQVLSLGRAAEWVGLSRIEFQRALKSHGIPLHYEVSDLHEELSNLEKIGL